MLEVWQTLQGPPGSIRGTRAIKAGLTFLKTFFEHLFFSSTHNSNAFQVMTTARQHINSLKPYTLVGFEPRIICSVGGRADHYATPLHFRVSYS
jgi:hypothetical protein